MPTEFIADDLADLIVNEEGDPVGYRTLVDSLRLNSRHPHKIPFTYGVTNERAVIRSDLQQLTKRFQVQQWPVRYDWPPKLRSAAAKRFQVNPEDVDLPLSLTPNLRATKPLATGTIVISLHPEIRMVELLNWSSSRAPIDPQPAIDEISARLLDRFTRLLAPRMTFEEWAALEPVPARQILTGTRSGRPPTEDQVWLERATTAAGAPKGQHRQELIRQYSNSSESTIEKWISRMKQESTDTDPLENALLWTEGPRNRPVVHLTDYAKTKLADLRTRQQGG